MASDVEKTLREEAYAQLMLARSAKVLVDNADYSPVTGWIVGADDIDDLREKLDDVARAAEASIVVHANHKEPARTSPEDRAVDLGSWIIVGGGEPSYIVSKDYITMRDKAGFVHATFPLTAPLPGNGFDNEKRLKLLATARAAAQIARETP